MNRNDNFINIFTYNTCRLCLQNTKLLFNLYNEDLLTKLKFCTIIEFDKNDGLPKKICSNCVDEVSIAYNFINKSNINDVKVREYFHIKKKKLISSIPIIIKPNYVHQETNTCSNINFNYDNIDVYNEITNSSDKINSDTTDSIISEASNSKFDNNIVNNKNEVTRNKISRKKIEKHISTYSQNDDFNAGDLIFPCEHCGIIFRRHCALETHMKTCEDQNENSLSVYETTDSDVTSEQQSLYELNSSINDSFEYNLTARQNRTQSTQHICHICSMTFTHKCYLKRHLMVHSGERPFKCNQCSKSYMLAHDLTRHRRVHTGERPYKCDICLNTFLNKSNMITHRMQHSNDRPFKCQLCSNTYKLRSHLMRHINASH